MPLRAASSVMSYVGPDGCSHQRPVTKKATKTAPAEFGDLVITCVNCEPTLAGHELWGPAHKPAPLTRDEAEALETQQRAANMNILEGLAALPQFAEILQQLAKTIDKKG